VSTNVIQGFLKGEFDEAYIVYSQFVNTLVQRPAVRRILPVEADESTTAPASASSNYNYEPDEDVVLKDLLPRFAEVKSIKRCLKLLLASIAPAWWQCVMPQTTQKIYAANCP